MKTSLAIALTFTFAGTLSAQELPRRTLGCLPPSDFVMAGIRFTDTATEVRKKLGRPKRVTTHTGEDDGGFYAVTRYTFENLTIDIARNYVERVSTTSARTTSPGGLKVGMLETEAAQLLKYKSLGLEPGKISLGPCGDLGQEDLLLIFERKQADQPAVLTAIEISNYGP